MASFWRETKSFTAQIVSGAATSNPFSLGGYAMAGLFVPVINSAYLAFEVAPSGAPTAGGMSATDGPYSVINDKFGNIVSALTPGGTGGVALGADTMTQMAAFSGPMRVSANVAQTALRTFWVHLKG